MEGRSAIAAVMLLACSPCASALNPSHDISQYAHKAWTVREGFLTAAANSIAQAPDGYLWLGTEFGLLRVDGVQSVPWQPPAGQRFLASRIRALLAARDGRLWIGSAASAVSTTGRLCAIRSGFAQCYAQDGSLWIGGDEAVFHLPRGGAAEPIPWARLGREDLATTLLTDSEQGGLWIGFLQRGVAYFKDGQVRASYASADGLGEGRVTGLQLDRDGTLWAATEGGLSRVKNGHVATLRVRDDGRGIGAGLNIWSGTGTGAEVDLTVPGTIAYSKSPGLPRLQLFRKKVG